MKTEKQLIEDANSIIRSFKYVIDRHGDYTNWEGLKIQVENLLQEQHEYLHPTLKQIRLEKLKRISKIKM